VALAKSLEVFKDAAMEHLRKTYRTDAEPHDAIWVLTVPAIWRYVPYNIAGPHSL
jgi:hypothetical protein